MCPLVLNMKSLIGILFFVMNTPLALATDWNCRNHDMEISCSSEECESSDGFTPMDVSFNSKGSMSVCAYTGCWEGVGKVFSADNFTIIAGNNLKFSTSSSDDMNANFLIVIDTEDKVSVIKGFGYAMPMICKIKENENK